MEFPKDLEITVGVPEKHVTTMETYISFKISTKVGNEGMRVNSRNGSAMRDIGPVACMLRFSCKFIRL